jgi:Protein of unknown function (DUF499)
MKLKPWYDVVKPREDLREGKSQDASEFAVHLDRVRDGTARDDYRKPEQFFAKTFLAANLLDLSAQVVRRLSGETSHTSPVFNLVTNFGGGKTHALTLLYHLANNGPTAHGWLGVSQIRDAAAVKEIPKSRVAVFVGTEFDSLAGRGGEGGEPRRMTPWGEVAFQLGGEAAFNLVREHDEKRIAPGGDVIRKILPEKEPCLILFDELLNYSSRFRSLKLNEQAYDFLLNLSGALNPKSVLVVSLPASELEMTEADTNDFERLTKMLDRVGKAMTITAGAETSEIIRRRLFDWDTRALNTEGRVILTKDAQDTCYEFARWVGTHSTELSSSIPADHARAHFESCYPFHPCALSVFERKWQSVPKFQQTRGILRLLALWIQHAYTQAYRKAHPDPLLTLGTAPFSEPLFRAAVFEQLGSRALETAVTVDIAGRKEAHSLSLDAQAIESIQKERLHQKVATAVFFESNGGTTRSEATLPEIRLAVGHADMDLGNIETALDGLTDRCYYLTVERKNYKFSLKENLNKRYSDKRANIAPSLIEDTVKQEIQKQFAAKEGTERVFFPERSNQVLNRPVITFVICDMAHTMEDAKTTAAQIEQMTRECGTSARTFKSALVWVVAESPRALRDESRRLLAWEAIDSEAGDLKLDEMQRRQLSDNIKKSQRDLKEAVWRSYNRVFLLGKDNAIQEVPLGNVTSTFDSPITNIIEQLTFVDEFSKVITARILLKNWPTAFVEWPTKLVRDAIYASPQFPRIVKGTEAMQNAIANGVSRGELAYVGKTGSGAYKPFDYNKGLVALEVEISDDMFIVTKETAEAYLKKLQAPASEPEPLQPSPTFPTSTTTEPTPALLPTTTPTSSTFGSLKWSGEVPHQKWMNFYTKVLSRFVTGSGLKLRVSVEVAPQGGVSKQKVDEAKSALRELGLDDDVREE